MATKIKVEGMSCGHCKMRVENAVSALPEVDSAVVDLENGEVSVTFTDDGDHLEAVKSAVVEAGYTPV